jgi:3D (Asp-Asp-Asp) domain-containing protein
MSTSPPDRSAPGAPSLLPALPLVRLLCLLAATIALAGCAPIHATPKRRATNDKRSVAQESAAVPAEPEETEQEPPSSSAVPSPAPSVTRVLVVKASAYNSRRGQTDASPSIAAWGDRLQPGMKVIAVSRDLLELGLRRGQRVQIDGLEGDFVVLDRMPSRWRQKIDVYMGTDVRAALEWGVREVEIRWQPAPEDLEVDEAFDAAGGVEHVAD